MNAAIARELRVRIRHEIAGYTPVRDIPGSVLESLEEHARGITKKEAAALTKELLEAHLRKQERWPKTTDNDRLRAAFAQLEEQGIVARENFSCCGTCGASEMRDEVAEQEAKGRTIRGCVFFHQQDTDRAIEGEGLYFNFFSVDRQNNRKTAAIGRLLKKALEENGLETDWNGKWHTRIHATIDWKRRR